MSGRLLAPIIGAALTVPIMAYMVYILFKRLTLITLYIIELFMRHIRKIK